MLKFPIYLFLFYCSTALAQVDSNQMSHLDSFLQEVEILVEDEEARFRNELSDSNVKELAYFNQVDEANKHASKALVDSLITSLNIGNHKLVMLQGLAQILAKQNNAIRLLLDNMDVHGFDPEGLRSWDSTRYPCQEFLIKSRQRSQIVNEILFSDFLNTFQNKKRPLGDSLAVLLEIIKRLNWGEELIRLSLKHSDNKNKTMLLEKMLQRVNR